jgi:hypothetical protein
MSHIKKNKKKLSNMAASGVVVGKTCVLGQAIHVEGQPAMKLVTIEAGKKKLVPTFHDEDPKIRFEEFEFEVNLIEH